jgi:adenylyl- and sulfurtransferase ThiI
MEKVIILRYAEIYLKGKNRGFFERALENNLNIVEVYNSFSNYDIDLIDNTFVIVINNGEGISLEGKLKSSVCDNSTLNNRYALLEWLSNLK